MSCFLLRGRLFFNTKEVKKSRNQQSYKSQTRPVSKWLPSQFLKNVTSLVVKVYLEWILTSIHSVFYIESNYKFRTTPGAELDRKALDLEEPAYQLKQTWTELVQHNNIHAEKEAHI